MLCVWQDEPLLPAFSGQPPSRSVKRLSTQRALGTRTARAILSAVDAAAALPAAPIEMIQSLEQVRDASTRRVTTSSPLYIQCGVVTAKRTCPVFIHSA